MTTSPHPVLWLKAGAITDAAGLLIQPGSLLIELASPMHDESLAPLHGDLLAVGSHPQVATHPAAPHALQLQRPGSLIIPALINAHTHLDLTHLGTIEHDPQQGFVAWINQIRAGRLSTDELIRQSVQHGVECSLAGAVVAVGDIAGVGSLVPLKTLQDSPLVGVSFIEYFGIGAAEDGSTARIAAMTPHAAPPQSGVRLGLQPHAPYSAGPRLYRAAMTQAQRHDLPLATHLAETAEERAFIADAAGPLRQFLERLNLWTPQIANEVGAGKTPIEHLQAELAAAPWLLAHLNFVTDHDLSLLAEMDCSVAYCPRTHEFFSHEATLGPHPYRRLINAGVNVALGTDSVAGLPGFSAIGKGPLKPLTPWDDAKLLRRRDHANPLELLKMMTINAARALRMAESLFTLQPGPIAGLATIEIAGPATSSNPLAAALDSASSPQLMSGADLAKENSSTTDSHSAETS